MATTVPQSPPTVVLSWEQRQAICGVIWGDVEELNIEGAEKVRLLIAAGRLFEQLGWQDGSSLLSRMDPPTAGTELETYELTVDEKIQWLASEHLAPYVEEYARPTLEDCTAGPESYFEHIEPSEWSIRSYEFQHAISRGAVTATEAILEVA